VIGREDTLYRIEEDRAKKRKSSLERTIWANSKPRKKRLEHRANKNPPEAGGWGKSPGKEIKLWSRSKSDYMIELVAVSGVKHAGGVGEEGVPEGKVRQGSFVSCGEGHRLTGGGVCRGS